MGFSQGKRSPSSDQVTRWLTQAGAGNAPAFDKFYIATYRPLLRVARAICRNESHAEDILSEVYISIWRNASRFDSAKGAALTWSSRITTNRAYDFMKSPYNQPNSTDDDLVIVPDPTPNAEAVMLTKDRARVVAASLTLLGELDRELIEQAFFGGLTYRDIAQLRDMPLPTVKSRIKRSMGKMHSQLVAII